MGSYFKMPNADLIPKSQLEFYIGKEFDVTLNNEKIGKARITELLDDGRYKVEYDENAKIRLGIDIPRVKSDVMLFIK